MGLACFLANRYHGFIYDVHHQAKLSSSFSFMEQSRLAYCDGNFLHALSGDSLETYTSRCFSSAVGPMPRVCGCVRGTDRLVQEWLKQVEGESTVSAGAYTKLFY